MCLWKKVVCCERGCTTLSITPAICFYSTIRYSFRKKKVLFWQPVTRTLHLRKCIPCQKYWQAIRSQTQKVREVNHSAFPLLLLLSVAYFLTPLSFQVRFWHYCCLSNERKKRRKVLCRNTRGETGTVTVRFVLSIFSLCLFRLLSSILSFLAVVASTARPSRRTWQEQKITEVGQR